jgi:hypothetical protein
VIAISVGLSLVGLFLVVRSFKISKALTFTISRFLSPHRKSTFPSTSVKSVKSLG